MVRWKQQYPAGAPVHWSFTLRFGTTHRVPPPRPVDLPPPPPPRKPAFSSRTSMWYAEVAQQSQCGPGLCATLFRIERKPFVFPSGPLFAFTPGSRSPCPGIPSMAHVVARRIQIDFSVLQAGGEPALLSSNPEGIVGRLTRERGFGSA